MEKDVSKKSPIEIFHFENVDMKPSIKIKYLFHWISSQIISFSPDFMFLK